MKYSAKFVMTYQIPRVLGWTQSHFRLVTVPATPTFVFGIYLKRQIETNEATKDDPKSVWLTVWLCKRRALLRKVSSLYQKKKDTSKNLYCGFRSFNSEMEHELFKCCIYSLNTRERVDREGLFFSFRIR